MCDDATAHRVYQNLNLDCVVGDHYFITLNVLGYVELHMTGGGGGGLEIPPSDLGPEGADCREIRHAAPKLRERKRPRVLFFL